MSPATLRDVAAVAGVSVPTVSKIVTGRFGNTRVAPATVERVRAAIEELGYVPNAIGRQLRERRTGQIGVLLHPYTGEENVAARLMLDGAFLVGLSEAAAAHSVPALVVYALPEGTEILPPSGYRDGRIDGLLIRCARRREEQLLAGLDPERLPVVTLWRQEARAGMGYADVDHRGGAYAAVDHLLALGHRRIAFFGPPQDDDNTHVPLRYQGYGAALAAAGIAPRPAWYATDQRAVLDALRAPEPITAVFSVTDVWADELARFLASVGIRIPDDLSLVGFDNIGCTDAISGGLTTIDHPIQVMTVQGVGNLLALIEGAPAEACRTIIPTHLVVRHSTAPPPTTA